MKYVKKKKKSKLIPILLVTVLALAGLIAWMLWSVSKQDSSENPPVQTESAQQTEAPEANSEIPETQPVETAPVATESEETTAVETAPVETEAAATLPEEVQIPDMEIETEYATLYYPGQWEQYLVTEKTELDFGMDLAFFANIAGEKCWLFTVHFGGAEGIPVGMLETSMGYVIDVTIEMSDFVPGDSWSAENTDLFCAMQEAMNYVSEKLTQTPGFEG